MQETALSDFPTYLMNNEYVLMNAFDTCMYMYVRNIYVCIHIARFILPMLLRL